MHSIFLQALSKALLGLRAEMTAAAEQQIISVASQKEAHMNVQQLVDRQTKELRVSSKQYICIMLPIFPSYENRE